MKTRTVTLEVEIEGQLPDALRLQEAVRRLTNGRYEWNGWRVVNAEVLEERQGAA